MNRDRCQIVLTGQQEGQFAVIHQRQALALGIVHGVKRGFPLRLGADFLGQVSDLNGTHIDDGIFAFIAKIVFSIHDLPLLDLDALHHGFGLDAVQIDMQQTVFHHGLAHLDPVRQNKGPLELPRRDAAMQKHAPVQVFFLAATDHQLPIFQRDRQILFGETGHGQGNFVRVFRGLLDIERRIPLIAGFRVAFQQAFKLVKSQQIRVRPQGKLRHRHVLQKRQSSQAGPQIGDPLLRNMGMVTQGCKTFAKHLVFSMLSEPLTTRITDMNAPTDISMKTDEVLMVELEVFRQEHRDLDEAITAMVERGTADQLTIQRLKKKKLRLKDMISLIEDRLTPDIIA